MSKSIEIKKNIYWIGALDPELRIFDIVMYTPYGTTYNSFAIKGSKKTAVFETVKEPFFNEFLERLKSSKIDPKDIDYIIVDHTEPDHAGSISKLLELAPKAKVVGSNAAIKFIKSIANREFNSIIVKQGDTLSLGDKTLKFISAPFLHWPDSIYTYIPEDKLLITCDSFGCHYCNPKLFNDLNEDNEKYTEALKYYFDGIMGPFKKYVLEAIDKIKDLDIDIICPGHGPVLRDNPQKIVELYKQWSLDTSNPNSKKHIVIPYVSAYGYTETIANKIIEGIKASHDFDVKSYNVIYSDINEILNDINRSDGILFGSPTINGDALKPILDILISLNPKIHGGKLAAAFGSYGWSGEAVSIIESRLKQLKMDVLSPGLKINFKPSEKELESAYKFGETFAEKIQQNANNVSKTLKPTTTKKWKCLICGMVFEGPEPPKICPVCGADSSQFVEVKEHTSDFTNSNSNKFIIIGNGAAGLNAAQSIRSRNEKASIKIVSEENYITYYRPELSEYLSTDIEEDKFYVKNRKWYDDNNIDLILNTSVKAILPDSKKILLQNNEELNYDKLIIANGSVNFIPPINGTDKKGVFTLKFLKDADNIKAYINKSKSAVIVGGGLLGLEAAWEMKKSGLSVTVVEFSNRLLSRQLDNEGATMFKESVDKSGVEIILGDSVEEIIGNEKVSGVRLKSGKTIDTDILLFSVGIRPNKHLAEKSGIKTNKGIIVNDKMETSIKDIYACGDICEYNNRVYGNWPASVEMGKIAGANSTGDESHFTSFVSSVIFSSMNSNLFSCGKFSPDLKDISYSNPSIGEYLKLFFEEDKLVGGILLGDTRKSGKIMLAIQKCKTLTDILKENFL
ncbi:FAD-dependent oxidoreductase [Clostridium sp. LBM24168]